MDKNERLDELLGRQDAVTVHPMEQGFEAEVMLIRSAEERYVLKVWNKSSKPDIRFQYCLLNALFERGISVSRPLGWGTDPNGHQVLLTTFDGKSVNKANKRKMTDIARLLSSLHRIDVEDLGDIRLPRFDFIDYFFPGASEHADIAEALSSIVRKTPMKQERLIHGDFHLNNLVEDENGRCAVIDWTNGQLGDPRYDFAWSVTLKSIYVSDRLAAAFRSAYLSANELEPEELAAFEALACLRWILLYRSGGAPGGPEQVAKVNRLMANNAWLNAYRFSIA
ncbi:aminoglycoside phosphotransferase family protein [Paenibacillus rhizovicinus]|uniref:Aminoglycoside phosphotransferase family protein n=2 Tax=Paenibacillus rhizovicinus TaxID=2704463 RepID=A0A6C0P9G5_9BACL|nr:aminoglycoside phosphotransferase family protein [Paenibacillus rhizovicinus]